MHKSIELSKLVANPYRDIENYEIIEDKIAQLIESFKSTGYWGNIVGRELDGKIQIAYGHHRLEALRRYQKRGKVDVIIRKLTNEDMIRIMAAENLEEWGSSIWVEMETVKSTIEAYARGEIELGKMPRDTNKSLICDAPSVIRDAQQATVERPYTHIQVARFLGWTRADGDLPDNKCEIAFKCLEAIEVGCIKPAHLRGLSREEAKALCGKSISAYRMAKSRIKDIEPNASDTQREAKAKAVANKTARELRNIVTRDKGGLRDLRSSSKANEIVDAEVGQAPTDTRPTFHRDFNRLTTLIKQMLADDRVAATLDSLWKNEYREVTARHYEELGRELASLLRRTDKWIKRMEGKHAKATS